MFFEKILFYVKEILIAFLALFSLILGFYLLKDSNKKGRDER